MNNNAVGPLSFVRLLSFCLLATLLSGCGGGAPVVSGSSSGSSSGAAPLAVSLVSPKEIPVGSAAVMIVVTGTGFTPSTVIQLSGVPLQTTYVSSTQIEATIPASQLQTGTILKLAVADGAMVVAADAENDVQVDNPEPTVSSLAPSSVVVNSPAGTITVTGTNFVSGVTLTVNGSPRNTAYVSPTELTASLTSGDFLSAAPLLLNAVNPQPGGGASGTIPLVVTNPAPTVTSLSPSTLNAGSAATVVNIAGTGFVSGTGVLVNGASRPATLISGTAMTVALTSADLSTAGSLGITAVNPAPGGGVSSSSSIVINNPVPGAITLAPASAIAGTGTAQITVTGSSFVPATVVYVNGQPRTTTYVSMTQLVASLTSADLATAGSLSVVATSPSPGGGTTAAALLSVNNPAPGSITVAPNLVTTGTVTVTPITVTGANFVPSTVVQINGNSRATTFISSTQLLSSLTVADQAAAGSLAVNAFTPMPGGGTSSGASIAINNPALGSISLSPSTVPAGKTTSTIVTVMGTGMVPGTGVQVNGSARATTYVSANQVSFVLPASDVSAAGALNVTAVNPAPNYSVSAAATLTVTAPTATPVITSLSQTSAIAGSTAFTLSATGTGFTSNCTLQWNATALVTSYGYGTIYDPVAGYTTGYFLYGAIPPSLLTTIGSASITANCPTAETPTSNAITFNVTNPPVPTLTSLSLSAGPITTDANLTLSGTGFSGASIVSYNGQAVTTTYSSSTSLTAIIPASQLLTPGIGNVTVFTPAPGGGTSNALVYTAYVPLVNNSMVYNPTNGLLYVSVPSSAGATYGNSIVSVDPQTGAIGTPIRVGSEPNKLALSSDGTILWVGLDGASAVRQVNLTTGTAGLQFSLGGNGGVYDSPHTALALAALPGAPNSVIVATEIYDVYEGQIAIYDSGVLRGASPTGYNEGAFYSIFVDGTKNEIYAGGSTYDTFTYSASGLTPLAVGNSGNSYASGSSDEMQIAGGRLYTDFGQASDPESGALLGTFYSTGTTPATGPTTADTMLGKVFILDNTQMYSAGNYNQIQVFNLSDFTLASDAVIPVSLPQVNSYNYNSYPSRLTRWGTNGLAFRTAVGIFSLRSNLVKDLSSTSADLGVQLSAAGSNITGSNTTYTATVTNQGPSASTNASLTALIPSSGVLVSATSSSGTCSTTNGVSCDLGGIASGSSATITLVVQQTAAGPAILSVQASGSENDPNAENNQASSTATITGGVYNLVPTVSSIAPSAILSGASDTVITVTGSGFNNQTSVLMGSTPLSTSLSSSTQVTAIVPAAALATLGWQPISVSNPSPGGGVSTAVPLSIYSVITIGLNHILYDPYSRKIMASVGSGSTTVTGNSIVAITPDTATVGTAVPIGSQPTNVALTSDGQILYTILSGSESVARFNMLTQQPDFTYAVPANSSFDGGIALRGIAAQPGTENTIALDIAGFSGNAIYDFDPSKQTAAIRGQASGPYSGSCLSFLDAGDLLAFDTDTSGATLDHYTVTSAGFTYYNYSQYTESTLYGFGCFKLSGGLAFGNAGGVANPATVPATQIGVYPVTGGGTFSTTATLAPDTSLQRTFFLVNTQLGSNSGSAVDGIQAFDQNTFLPTTETFLNMETIEGNSGYTGVDLIRWGQDGLAALTSSGHLYLLRGAAVVPQLMNQNSAAGLSSSSVTTITHGSGNTLITLAGSNFVPGVAVMWDGSYRTTTIVDATHLTVAIPASDLATAGTASVTVVNPGAATSSALTITIQ